MSALGALLLGLAVAQIQAGTEVTASIDRTRISLGEEVMLTVRTRTRSPEPVAIVLPPLNGFAIVGSRDYTEVALGGPGGQAVRTTVRELQLRAEQAGGLVIGPIRARQGNRVAVTDPILITVDTSSSRVATALSPIARALLDRAPPPSPAAARRPDGVALTVLVPSDSVLVGEQVDVIAAAWFPRELRERMRRLPVLTVRTPEGVWAYPATTPSGIAAARLVGGKWMDLFITHQIVFPLAPGQLVIPPATVEYGLPVTFSFFSREERYSLRTDTARVAVLPLPEGGSGGPGGTGGTGGADQSRVVGDALALELTVTPAATRAGEPIEAAATISGIGNVALWPEPELRWPRGFRSYPAETEVRMEPRDGRIAGSKTYRFLAVPDSTGGFVLPEVRYPYFDLRARRYAVAAAPSRPLMVAPGPERGAARALPPLLGRASLREPVVERVGRVTGMAALQTAALAVVLLPPLVAGIVRRRRRRRDAAGAVTLPPARTALGGLEREFLAVLASHVPDRAARDGDRLAQALRAAGIEGVVADHVQRLRDRLRAARYGPRGLGDAAELAAELQQVLRVLGAGAEREPRRRRLIATMAVLVLWTPALSAQAPSAEALYEAGALRVATDSFAARAAAAPREAAHWYNLGATLYRAGADGKAVVAWTRAARLVPRDAAVRRARNLLPPPDPVTARLLRVAWATPLEWAVLAVAAWVALWMLVPGWPRRRAAVLLLGAAAVGAAAAGATEWQRRNRGVAVVVADSAALRAAPYGGASATATLASGRAVLAGRAYGAWREVRLPDGVRGWVLATEIVPL